MRSLLRVSTLTLAGLVALQAVEWQPAPAVITKLTDKGKSGAAFDEAFVISESLDGIEFLVDDPKGSNKLSLKAGSYRVTYDHTKDVDFLRAERQEADGKAEQAATFYEKATTASRFAWAHEGAFLGLARTNLALKRYDAAIAAADQLAKESPRSLLLDDALLAKGKAQQAKGDAAGAKATYSSLVGMTKEWGDRALITGSLGLASLQAEEKKPAEAATTLTPVLARLDPAKDPELYGTVGLSLAEHHLAAGKPDQAIAVLNKLAYGPVSISGEANLRLATLLVSQGDQLATLQQAFDRAAIAATLRGAPQAVSDEGRKLARSIVDKLQKVSGLTDAQKLEYRQARDNL